MDTAVSKEQKTTCDKCGEAIKQNASSSNARLYNKDNRKLCDLCFEEEVMERFDD